MNFQNNYKLFYKSKHNCFHTQTKIKIPWRIQSLPDIHGAALCKKPLIIFTNRSISDVYHCSQYASEMT